MKNKQVTDTKKVYSVFENWYAIEEHVVKVKKEGVSSDRGWLY